MLSEVFSKYIAAECGIDPFIESDIGQFKNHLNYDKFFRIRGEVESEKWMETPLYMTMIRYKHFVFCIRTRIKQNNGFWIVDFSVFVRWDWASGSLTGPTMSVSFNLEEREKSLAEIARACLADLDRCFSKWSALPSS